MRRLVAALALGLALASGAAAKPVQLTAAEMRNFGTLALGRGYADQALSVAEALLARDGTDAQALILKAQALRVLQRLAESEAAARAAWAAAKTPGERFMAASVLAQALSLQGHRIVAQYWLRQAAQNAPSAGAQAQALQDLRYVRGETPVTLHFDLSLQPSDNVNGGARVSTFDFLGLSLNLPPKLTAQPGLAWSLGVSGDWRIAASEAAETRLTFALQRSGARLSDRGTGLRDGDFDFLHLGAGIEREGRGGGRIGLELGRNWYAGADLSQTLGLEGVVGRRLGPGRLELSASLTREHRLDEASASSTSGELGLGYGLAGPRGDRWQGGAQWAVVASDSDTVARHEIGLSLDWQGARTLGGIGLSAHLGLRGAEYGSGRQDGILSARIDAEVTRAAWLGFAPVVSLNWSRSNSNVLIHDSETMGLGLAIRSRF